MSSVNEVSEVLQGRELAFLIIAAIFLVLWLIWVIAAAFKNKRVKNKNKVIYSQYENSIALLDKLLAKDDEIEALENEVHSLKVQMEHDKIGAAVVDANDALVEPVTSNFPKAAAAEPEPAASEQPAEEQAPEEKPKWTPIGDAEDAAIEKPAWNTEGPEEKTDQPAPAQPAPAAETKPEPKPEPTKQPEEKPKKFGRKEEEDLSDNQRIFRKIMKEVESSKLYLDPDVDKSSIADLMGMDKKEVDKIIKSESREGSISGFLDHMRLRAALPALKEFKEGYVPEDMASADQNDDKEYNEVDIAVASGFKSLGAMNKACKANLSMTLKELMKII